MREDMGINTRSNSMENLIKLPVFTTSSLKFEAIKHVLTLVALFLPRRRWPHQSCTWSRCCTPTGIQHVLVIL
jgi:hypothetical protein